jgi:fructose-specific phosphotransferase system IIC component
MARNGFHQTLGVISFGLAVAITSAAFTFFLGLMATFFGWGVELAGALSSLYIGFSPTFVGTIAGAVWAFVDGFVAGVMIAWLYNKFLLRRAAHLAPPHHPAQAPVPPHSHPPAPKPESEQSV